MSVDGRRFVLVSLLLLAVCGVVASTRWAWFWAGVSLDNRPLPRQQHLDEALASALGAGLLLLAAVPMRLLRVPLWLTVLVAVIVSCLGAATVVELLSAADAPVRHAEDSGWTLTVQQFCIAPTTWPMLLFVVGAPLLRGRSRPGPRSARDR